AESFDVLAVRQRGERFTDEQRVSVSEASDWAPQIAAGPRGELAVVWDTYDKGDYDVYLRRLRFRRGIRMEGPLPVAASNRFEARATAVYDAKGAVWVGWEESYPAWGKDFGAYETSGTGLYQGSTVRVRVLEGGKYFRTAESLEATLERQPASHPMNRLGYPQRLDHGYTPQPAPELAENRRSG
ncbi:MAG: hypothetical protein GY953_39685, partial [bacterium]|nr:hypothetical protein [bacterium]